MRFLNDHRQNFQLLIVGIFFLVMFVISPDDEINSESLFVIFIVSLCLVAMLAFIQNRLYAVGTILMLSILSSLVLLSFRFVQISEQNYQLVVAFSKIFGSTILILYGLNILKSKSS